MIEIVFAVEKQGAHKAIVTEIPRALDDVAFAEGVANVLARGPVESEAAIKHESVLPTQIEQLEQREKEANNEQGFPAHEPDGGVLDAVEQIAAWL